MMRLALCIGEEHDLRLTALAVLICLVGSAATGQLFQRVKSAAGAVRAGWLMLASVGIGTMVWSTHFVAMMGFRAKVPVTLDPGLTLLSLLVVIGLAVPGLIVAKKIARGAGFAGGAIIGAGIATMHYLGMSAYRVAVRDKWPQRQDSSARHARARRCAAALYRHGRDEHRCARSWRQWALEPYSGPARGLHVGRRTSGCRLCRRQCADRRTDTE